MLLSDNQLPDDEVVQDPRAITWGIHPNLVDRSAEWRFQVVHNAVNQAISACGVTDIMQVIPAGWNNGVAGPLREQRGPKGTKHAFYPVYEMLLHWNRIISSPYSYRDLSACLYEAEKVIEYFQV